MHLTRIAICGGGNGAQALLLLRFTEERLGVGD